MYKSENGSISIVFLLLTMLLSGSFLGNVLLKTLLMETSSHRNLCRKEVIKLNHLRGKKAQKLISLNKRIKKYRARKRWILGQLALNPSPVHKLKLAAQLKRIKIRLAKIALNQKQVLMSFRAQSKLQLERIQRKVSKICQQYRSKCSRARFSQSIKLPVQKMGINQPTLYQWDPKEAHTPLLSWRFSTKTIDLKKLLIEKTRNGVTIRCGSKLKTNQNRYILSTLAQVKESSN